jgi:hypothetical protein
MSVGVRLIRVGSRDLGEGHQVQGDRVVGGRVPPLVQSRDLGGVALVAGWRSAVVVEAPLRWDTRSTSCAAAASSRFVHPRRKSWLLGEVAIALGSTRFGPCLTSRSCRRLRRGRTSTLGRKEQCSFGYGRASPQVQRGRLPEKVEGNLRDVLAKLQVRMASRTPRQPPMAPSPRCNGMAAWRTPQRQWAYSSSAVGAWASSMPLQ